MGRLSLEDFMQEVKEKLQKRYKNLKVFTSENIKNNGTKVYAVTIVNRASSVSPCTNVEGYYKNLKVENVIWKKLLWILRKFMRKMF